jgi:thioredoxin reductase (NADPH)
MLLRLNVPCVKIIIYKMALETIVVNDENQYDIFIIGAGPSGLSAAIYSARSGLKTCFIDKSTPGGKIVGLKNITNFPGFKNISGTELSTNLYTQAIAAGSKYIYGTVVNVVEKLGYLAVYSDDGNT